MKILIASDHAGFELKEYLKKNLSSSDISILDLGPSDSTSVDYPDYADKVCQQIPDQSPASNIMGILICGSGQGMCIRANKFSHIRAALCSSPEITELSRKHNDANVLCLGARFTDSSMASELALKFIQTEFEGGRHARRVEKLHKNTSQ